MAENAEPKSTGRRTIAVFGAYSAPHKSDAFRFAYDLGTALADAGFNVVNGGYDGTMRAVSQGARDHGGHVTGVTCPSMIRANNNPLTPNAYLDEVIPATDLLSRIDTMMRMAGGFVVLDGGTGTLTEFAIVWEHVSKGFLPPRPIVLAHDSWNHTVHALIGRKPSCSRYLHSVADVGQIVAILDEHAVRIRTPRSQTIDSEEPTAIQRDEETSVADLRRMIDRFVNERDWHQFHDPKNLAASIAIEAAELMEHFQWSRSDELDKLAGDAQTRAGATEEIADVLAYVLSFANAMGIDLSAALAEKTRKNAAKYPVDAFRGRAR